MTVSRFCAVVLVLGASPCLGSDDVTALVQSAVRAHVEEVTPDSKTQCGCLNWKELYESGVECGSAIELSALSGGESMDYGGCRDNFFQMSLGQGGTAFFPRQNHSYCVRVRRSTPRSTEKEELGNWCYVDPECAKGDQHSPALNGGMMQRGAGEQHKIIAWKKCAADEPSLTDLPPATLFQMGSDFKVDHPSMASMAYPWVGDNVWKVGSRHKIKNLVSCSEGICPGMGPGGDGDSFAFRFGNERWMWNPTEYNVTCRMGCENLKVTTILRTV